LSYLPFLVKLSGENLANFGQRLAGACFDLAQAVSFATLRFVAWSRAAPRFSKVIFGVNYRVDSRYDQKPKMCDISSVNVIGGT